MTTEEAVVCLECMAIDMTGGMAGLSDMSPMKDLLERRIEAINLAQDALRTKQERENPEPLTLDELREMNAPVWCLCKPIEGGNGYWCLCQNGQITTPAGSQYLAGEIPHWVFLRHKPKEESKC